MKKLRGARKQDALLNGEFRYCGVAAAVIGAAVVGAVASNAASNKAAHAQEDASNAGIAAQEKNGDADRAQQKYFYDQNRTDQLAQIAQARVDAQPYRTAGETSLRSLVSRTGADGDLSKNYQRGNFEADPGYQFRTQEGEKGIQRAASARGGLYSGATLKALARFNSGLASQEYGAFDTRENNKENQFNLNRDYQRNNLATLAGIGQTSTRDVTQAGATGTGAIGAAGSQAAGQIGQSYMNQGNQIAGLMGNAGEARASGYIGGANALTGAIGQGLNYYNNRNLIQSLSRGGGSGSGQGFPAYGKENPYGYNSGGYPVDSSGEMQFDP